jgi:hypothetical protein
MTNASDDNGDNPRKETLTEGTLQTQKPYENGNKQKS